MLSGGEMVVSCEGRAPQRVPLAAVDEVKLRFHRTRSWTAHQCFVGYGQGRVMLQDLHFKGIADAVSKGAEYSDFVRALHAALAQQGGAVRYRAGSAVSFAGGIVAALVMAGMLAVALMMRWWMIAVLTAFVLLRLMPTIRRSRPVTYTPDRLPGKLLPR